MKTNLNPKPDQNSADPAGFRVGRGRPNVAKTFEHRYERRKIREQLRRLDWALNNEDAF